MPTLTGRNRNYRPKCKVNLETSVTVNCIISIHFSISKTHSTLTFVNERRVELCNYKANNQKYPADMSCGENQFIILTAIDAYCNSRNSNNSSFL